MRVLKKRESIPSLKNGVVKRVSPTAVSGQLQHSQN
jgi:hypothetical protein